MDAGRLNRRVRIEVNTPTRNALGEDVPSWSLVAEVWAAKLPIRGAELIRIRSAGAELTTRFLIRYRPGILPTMRIVEGSTEFEILEVIDREDAHDELEILCVSEAVAT